MCVEETLLLLWTPYHVCSGHTMTECTGEAKEKEGEFDEMAGAAIVMEKQFIFVRLCVLREASVVVGAIWEKGGRGWGCGLLG